MKHNLFVYGTLEISLITKQLLGVKLIGELARLDGYRCRLLRANCYPGITKSSEDSVHGVVYQDVCPKYLKILDRYEEALYERKMLKVTLPTENQSSSNSVMAWGYVIPRRYAYQLSSRYWNRQYFCRYHLKRFLLNQGLSRFNWEKMS